SSVMMMLPAPTRRLESKQLHESNSEHAIPSRLSSWQIREASLPVGAITSTRRSSDRRLAWAWFSTRKLFSRIANKSRHSRQDSFEFLQRSTHLNSVLYERQLADRALVPPGSLFQYRQRLSHLAGSFEIAEQ